MDLPCEAEEGVIALLKKRLIRRDLFEDGVKGFVIRTDDGSQFVSYKFNESCEEIKIEHERIPEKEPNRNVYVKSFHRIYRILDVECLKINEV